MTCLQIHNHPAWRRIVPCVALAMLGALASAGMLRAQEPLAVEAVSALTLGAVERGQSETIPWNSADAAQLVITGEPGQKIILQVIPHQLENQDGNVAAVEITNEQCAYSLDGGVTWRNFKSGYLSQETKLPKNKDGDVATILVRIGGTFQARERGTRGTYSGSIELIVMPATGDGTNITEGDPATTGDELGSPPEENFEPVTTGSQSTARPVTQQSTR